MSLCALFAIAFMPSASAQELRPLLDLERQLDTTPPAFENAEARLAIFRELDRWALADDTVYWDGNSATANAEWLAFYRRRIDKVLREIPETEVRGGIAIWKMYSSGFVVKSPRAVFAIDVVEGPFKDIRKSPDDVPEFAFKWTPEQRRRYAELVAAQFITHWHYDHASFAIARELIRAGKTVVVPQQLKDHWAQFDFGDKLTVLTPGVDHALCGLTIQAFRGAQYMQTDDNGNWISGKHDCENNLYWIDAGGTTVMHNGDNRGIDCYPWLRQLKAAGKGLDVWFSILEWPRGLTQTVAEIHDPLIIPGHEHEVGHKPVHGVTRLEGKYGGIKARFARGKGMQLYWGEQFVVPGRGRE